MTDIEVIEYVKIVHRRILAHINKLIVCERIVIPDDKVVISMMLSEAYAAVLYDMVPASHDKAGASYRGSGHVTDEGAQRG